jgi:hypothetical protein
VLAGFAATILLTTVAFNFAMVAELGSPPSIPSTSNLLFASFAGACCGVIGSLPVCLIASITPGSRAAVIVFLSVCWAGVSGLCFSCIVAFITTH